MQLDETVAMCGICTLSTRIIPGFPTVFWRVTTGRLQVTEEAEEVPFEHARLDRGYLLRPVLLPAERQLGLAFRPAVHPTEDLPSPMRALPRRPARKSVVSNYLFCDICAHCG